MEFKQQVNKSSLKEILKSLPHINLILNFLGTHKQSCFIHVLEKAAELSHLHISTRIHQCMIYMVTYNAVYIFDLTSECTENMKNLILV